MKTATREITKIEGPDEGTWLHALLADIQREISEQPGPGAIERIRGRLLAQIDRPTRAAA
jgi:folate-binding Fe-S cluster repair protein YgfZ